MPASQQSLALAEVFRREQLAVRAAFWRDMIRLWPLLTRATTRAERDDWMRLAVVLVQRYRDASAAGAQHYVARARLLDVGPGGPSVGIEPMPADQIVVTLNATGPYTLDNGPRLGKTPAQAEKDALARTLAASGQLVHDGAHDVVQRHLEADQAALGWMRVTDGDPCSFCAMLASRGAVYTSRKAAGGTAELVDPAKVLPGGDPLSFKSDWHNGCGCQVVPVFTPDPVVPQTSIQAENLWKAATKGLSNNEARKAYRRAVEGRPFPEDPIIQWAQEHPHA